MSKEAFAIGFITAALLVWMAGDCGGGTREEDPDVPEPQRFHMRAGDIYLGSEQLSQDEACSRMRDGDVLALYGAEHGVVTALSSCAHIHIVE